ATDRRESIESAGWQILRTFNTKGRRGLEGAYQQAILRVMMNDAAAIGARCIVRVGAHEPPARTARNRRHADRGGGQGNQPFRRGQLRGSRRSLSIKCEENVASHPGTSSRRKSSLRRIGERIHHAVIWRSVYHHPVELLARQAKSGAAGRLVHHLHRTGPLIGGISQITLAWSYGVDCLALEGAGRKDARCRSDPNPPRIIHSQGGLVPFPAGRIPGT